MLANRNDLGGQRVRDGVMTRRGTFQKYYTQAEIKAFLTSALDEEPIPVALGVLYVFRDKDEEQRTLSTRRWQVDGLRLVRPAAPHERNRRGAPVCERLGAAADFIVDDEDMVEVARWVAANTPFDRLHLYGPDLPIHVSVGPAHTRQAVRMVPGKGGRLVPRAIALEAFLAEASG